MKQERWTLKFTAGTLAICSIYSVFPAMAQETVTQSMAVPPHRVAARLYRIFAIISLEPRLVWTKRIRLVFQKPNSP